jgi:hypothetical protein
MSQLVKEGQYGTALMLYDSNQGEGMLLPLCELFLAVLAMDYRDTNESLKSQKRMLTIILQYAYNERMFSAIFRHCTANLPKAASVDETRADPSLAARNKRAAEMIENAASAFKGYYFGAEVLVNWAGDLGGHMTPELFARLFPLWPSALPVNSHQYLWSRVAGEPESKLRK